jgi:hypothetical protein
MMRCTDPSVGGMCSIELRELYSPSILLFFLNTIDEKARGCA